jgi:ribosome-associated protein
MDFVVTPSVRIDMNELEFSYARSSGPGGQNVNKVNSKAILRWNLLNSGSLTPEIHSRLLCRLRGRLTSDGALVISSDCFRDQLRNREDCLAKLRQLILTGIAIPKQRKKTKPSYSSRLKRKEGKSRQSQKKNLRKSPRFE